MTPGTSAPTAADESLTVLFLTKTLLAQQEASGVATDLYFGVLLRLRGTPVGIDTLRALVSDHLDSLPVLTHRLVATREGGLGWERDPHFDLRAHVGVLASPLAQPEPAGVWLGGDPRPERPLWRMWLLPGDGDIWGIGYVVHHAAQDGTAVVRTLELLFGDGHSSTRPLVPSRRHRPWQALRAAPDLLATLRPAIDVAALPASPGDGRRVTWRTAPLSELRLISEASGATIGQVHLAVLAGAIRRWSPADFTDKSWRARRRALPVCVPVDTGRCGEDSRTAGNLIGLMRVALPCGETEPRRRLRTVRARASRARVAVRRSALRALTEDVPTPVGAACLARLGDRRNIAMTASSLPAIGPLAISGRPVEHVIAIPWLPPAHSCFSILTRYQEHVTLSVLTTDGTGESADLADCWVDALNELRMVFNHSGRGREGVR